MFASSNLGYTPPPVDPGTSGDVFLVANQAAMLALSATKGDMAKRADNGKVYRLITDDPTTLANWVEVSDLSPAAADISDAGATGISLIQAATASAAQSAIKLNVHGADIASAATVNLDAATGDLIDITGTTTVTAFTLAEGQRRLCRAVGIFQITAGASLVLPTSGNLTTAAGDFFEVAGYGAGVVRVSNYTRKDGTALTGVVDWSDLPQAVYVPDNTLAFQDNLAVVSINVNNRTIHDSSGVSSVNWNSRLLMNTLGSPVASWGNLSLYDTASGALSMDWGARELYNSGEVATVDYGNYALKESAGTAVLLWDAQLLRDTSGVASHDWQNRAFYDVSGNPSIEYQNRYLFNAATNITVDYGNFTLIAAGGFATVNWDALQLNDQTGDLSADWSLRQLVDGAGVTSCDWDLRIWYDTIGNATADLGARVLYDAANAASINYNSRFLLDNGGAATASWDNGPFVLSQPIQLANTAVASGAVVNTHTVTMRDDTGTTYRLLCLV